MQIIPIAPQVNLQNVNVGTFGDVNQGNANNANTGQAAQQENTQTAAPQHETNNKWTGKGPSQAGSQRNDADQGQVQIIPIAPQLNAQNVNVLTFDDVNQGNANNANTGQAVQQQNTQTGPPPSRTGSASGRVKAPARPAPSATTPIRDRCKSSRSRRS